MTSRDLAYFVLGNATAFTSIAIWGYYLVNKAVKKRKEEITGSAKDMQKKIDVLKKKINSLPTSEKGYADTVGSITKKLATAHDLTEQQLTIMNQLDQPQRSASHGKWKNDLRQVLAALEKEKLEVLCSIVKDGYDPPITVQDDQKQRKRIKLSEFLKHHGVDVDGLTAETKPEPSKPKPSKLTIVKGGKEPE